MDRLSGVDVAGTANFYAIARFSGSSCNAMAAIAMGEAVKQLR